MRAGGFGHAAHGISRLDLLGHETEDMELLSSAAVALASSWEAEPEPFDREASKILVGARLLVAGDDPVATDGLVGHLRAHGASVGVTDARFAVGR